MCYLLRPISQETFEGKVFIRFKSINEGFSRFEDFMLQDMTKDNSEEKFITFIDKAFQLNGEENSYIDFYLSRLDKEAVDNLFALLNEDDKAMLRRHVSEIKDNTIYFRLSREAIPFITRLNTREVFFCTFYFTKFPCTIWGNYNKKFPIFFNDKTDVEKYKNIADECGLLL